MKQVDELDADEASKLQALMTLRIVQVITSYPKSKEAAAAALAALLHCAYSLATRMWGIDDALKAIKIAIDLEAQKDRKDQQ